jgi:hypothetical protein
MYIAPGKGKRIKRANTFCRPQSLEVMVKPVGFDNTLTEFPDLDGSPIKDIVSKLDWKVVSDVVLEPIQVEYQHSNVIITPPIVPIRVSYEWENTFHERMNRYAMEDSYSGDKLYIYGWEESID